MSACVNLYVCICVSVCAHTHMLLCKGCPKPHALEGGPEEREKNSLGLVTHGSDIADPRTYFTIDEAAFGTSCYPPGRGGFQAGAWWGPLRGIKCWNPKASLISSPQRLDGMRRETRAQGHTAGKEQGWELCPGFCASHGDTPSAFPGHPSSCIQQSSTKNLFRTTHHVGG